MKGARSIVRAAGPARSAGLQARDRRRDQLAQLGLRVTANRLAVLALLESASHAMSHADIEAALPVAIDRVTLYRTLDSFVDAGLLTKSVGADRQNRFALRHGEQANHHQHAHFQCDDCGRVYCLAVQAPRELMVPPGFAVEGVDLQVHGHCADCAPVVHDPGALAPTAHGPQA